MNEWFSVVVMIQASSNVGAGGAAPMPRNVQSGISSGCVESHYRRGGLCGESLTVPLHADLQDCFSERSTPGKWRVRIVGKEDRERPRRDREPRVRAITVEADVACHVEFTIRGLARGKRLPADLLVTPEGQLDVDVLPVAFEARALRPRPSMRSIET